ncbi:hypothetical protein GBAR_LOCUS20878 [Geodia barretti]|uniref:Uncharacterized protein n=1 Tax=Geodia barretti TaxID=519541 RepID=A0AA35SXF0_GEOBA|nr:hypothetical protein GBAR_LOCUS20878 [Geodia barretti]
MSSIMRPTSSSGVESFPAFGVVLLLILLLILLPEE